MTHSGVALVTGAAQGIGRAIALRLARDGFDVAINDLDRDSSRQSLESLAKEIVAIGCRTYIVVSDVSLDYQVKSMIEDVVKELGSLDVMVANAGIACPWKTITDTTVEEWDEIFAVNARGVFLCYKYAAQQMITQGRGGRIIGACSTAGKRGEPMIGPYCSTKFAVRGLTQSAANELGQYGITVNAYAPGVITTNMIHSIDKDSLEHSSSNGTSFSEAVRARTASGYLGKAEDVAGLVSYIASKESHYVTGQTISCNGGVHFD